MIFCQKNEKQQKIPPLQNVVANSLVINFLLKNISLDNATKGGKLHKRTNLDQNSGGELNLEI